MIQLSPEQTEALLEHLVGRSNCSGGCKCVFCRTFDEGFKAGLEDAQTTFNNSLDALRRKVSA